MTQNLEQSDSLFEELKAQSMQEIVNVAAHLPRMATLQPERKAIVYSVGKGKYKHVTFDELNRDSDLLAQGLESVGIVRGTRTIMMVKPSLNFYSLTFALFKVGAIPVMIDPGMGVKRMLHCLAETQAEGFVGIPAAHVLRVLSPKSFRSVKYPVTVGTRLFWGGATLKQFRSKEWTPYEMAPTGRDDLAAILFTTGSTGPAKGVEYRHGVFDAQVRYLRSFFGISPGEVDLPTFPLFALFGPALGMTSVIPDMNPSKPAEVDPVKIIQAIQDNKATSMFGSPALLNRVGRYAQEHGIKLPTLNRVLSAGAPVTHDNLERFSEMLAERAQIFTPYGATECLPVAAIGSKELLGETKELTANGEGICVGRAMEGVTIRIIKIDDKPIPEWSDEIELPQGEIGEIVVKGPPVTYRYFGNLEATAKAKIQDGEDICHRMGDLGWIDAKDRLWFCGRMAHRLITPKGLMFTIPCESIFNQHPSVYRSALVGVGSQMSQKPVILIELEASAKSQDKKILKKELLDLALQNERTKDIEKLIFHPSFPVDIRHNAKIFREKLRVWAAKKLGVSNDG